MSFSMAGRGPSAPEMNVTPMIDVLLVLIVIFMIVSSDEKGVNAQIPQPAQEAAQPHQIDRTIVIQVAWGADGKSPSFKINQDPVSAENLEPRLHDIFKTRAEKVAFVKGDNDVDFEYVAQVIGLARQAGIERVGLLTR
jgi:biopolymer transport protein TolR